MRYTWNIAKAATNLKVHGVTFEEAIVALEDQNAFEDSDFGGGVRLNVIGWSSQARLLFVVFINYYPDDHVHIISARQATKDEASKYRNQHRP